ncbi:MAG: hypothetical protein V3R78_10270 [Thermodesulfobacteriota bacterium]
MDSTEKSEYLFNKLKRDTDCWHKWNSGLDVPSCVFPMCGKYWWGDEDDNPNFFSPSDKEWEYFGWMFERAKEQGILVTDILDPICRDSLCTALADALYEWFKEQDNE